VATIHRLISVALRQPIQSLVLLDAGLPGLTHLLRRLQPGTLALAVQASDDWAQVLSAAVAELRCASRLAPHWRLAVVAHGSPGLVAIGRETITAATVRARAADWRALAPTAIDLYSCFAGADPSLPEALATASGAVVSASSGVVGHPGLGGDWLLDQVQPASAGPAEAHNQVLPFSRAALAGWRHALATLTVGAGQAYATIQAAINAASAGDTINVLAGTYAENITINKPLTLLGARNGVKPLGTTRDGGESIISGTGGSSSYVITIEADNVTVDGFKVEITGSARDGINTRTNPLVTKPGNASLAYRENITLRNNWVYADLPSRTNQFNGIVFGESTTNTAQTVSAEIANVAIIDNYIDLTSTSSTATPANQSITGARGIVFTNMFRNSGAALDYTNLDVKNNTVFATYQTILQGQIQTRMPGAEFTGNTIGNSRSGPNLPNLTTNSTFSNNSIQNINPGSDYYSNLAGAYLGVVDSTISNNTFTNIGGTAGLVLAGGRSADSNFYPASRNSTVTGNSFTYNNQAVSPLAAYTSAILLEPNTTSSAVNVNGWLTGRLPGTTGVQASTITLSANTFTNTGTNSSLPAVAISQESAGTTLNAVHASPNVFGVVALNGSTTNEQLFAIADAVADAVDATTLGLVTLKSGEVFVTPASFWSPSATTTADVQRAVSSAAAGQTIQIKEGAYSSGAATTTVDNLTLYIPAGVSGFSGLVLGSGVTQATLTGPGSSQLIGNSGNNVLIANNSGNSTLSGADGNDSFTFTISAFGSGDSISGGAGIDTLTLSDSGHISDSAFSQVNTVEVLSLAGGNDSLSLGGAFAASGFSTVSAGAGSDSLNLAGDHSLTMGSADALVISGVTYSAFEAVSIGGSNSTLLGSAGNDALTITGAGSALAPIPINGITTYDLGAGQDAVTITATGSFTNLIGGSGSDSLHFSSAGTISDAAFTNVSGFEALTLANGSNVITLAAAAQLAGFATVTGGTGADSIDASAFSSSLTISGGAGNDTISLGSGADSLNAGDGDDRVLISLANLSSADSLAGGNGSDSLVLSSAGILADAAFTNLSSFALLQLANGSNTITLAAEANEAGFSSVVGGSGADSIDLTASSSSPTLALGAGSDTVVVAGSFDLSAHSGIEVLALNSSIAASLSGDASANLILGNSGNDTLNGGAGNDTLSGGAGNDLYITDSSSDLVVEAAAGGTDTVQSSASYTLPAEVETLLLTGSDSINGVGNSLANLIIGNSGNNILDGLGGNDTMVGGAGNDYYFVNSTLDVVSELSGEGSDTIFSGVSLTLPAQVETLVLSGLGSIAAVDASSEVLTASSHGLSNGDAIVVSSDRGSLQANTPYYLINATTNSFQLASAAGGTALNLVGGETGLYTVAYTSGSSYNLSATGNSLDNVLVGNAGSNIFNFNYSGGGGNDTMQGGAGNDVYFFDSAGDTAIEASGDAAGTDLVYSTVDVPYLPDNVENLVLQGSSDLAATGNGSANIILGNDGNNTIDGGRGIDSLAGGAGNDLYLVDVQEDFVEELANSGIDTIRARESYTAPLNVERLELSGSGRHNLTGNIQGNVLVGNDSANLLDGGGGNDTLEGLGGNDSYLVDSSGDLVIEASGGGRDTITTSVSYTLPAHVETLVLSGSASINGSGNSEANTIIGNEAANSLDGGGGADLLIGAGGNDTYFLDHAGDVVQELEGGGTDTVISSVSVNALFENVEVVMLSGSADLALSGNTANNWLVGNAGANTLDGGAGDDTLQGGAGNDLYRVDSSGDQVIEASGGGTDTISSSVSLSVLPDNVEVLVAQGRSALLLSGNGLANTVIGGRGADTLDGGVGSDTLQGLGGSDTYLVDNASDLVLEGNGPLDGRNDVVIASISISSLADNIETLILSGSANLSATGNSGRNTITGNSGNNILDGGGGRDLLIGGAGNDLYLVDSSDDRVIEQAGEGSDTLSASISIASLPENVEVLVLSGSADLNGTGNAAANTLLGNAGANRLDGGGGSDTLIGGGGNDFYVVDSADDLVIEAAGGGSDTISTSVSLSALPDHVEVGSLNSSAPLSLVGNSLANLLIGNRGDDSLDGAAGADTLVGGRGNDVYFIDNSGDLVIEAPRAGIDSVLSSISTSLADNVENLTLLDSGGAINGSGNSGNNTLTGNASANLLLGLAGNDVLSGGGGNDTLDGGAGADVLSGGSGADLFRFSSSDDIGRYSKVDSISDFNPSEGDRIDLSALASSLGRALSWLGSSPFSGSAGQVRYDSDGGLLGIDLTGNARNTTSIRLASGLSIGSGNLILS